ncbi:MAG: class I SAM-dependent methyltransferase [Candidatus Korobacteraceae bacterium]|jgi:demethylmenaquinone methyltransferase/2-methoxy-6-polyprenyl-1,4-benzoquinol methylase
MKNRNPVEPEVLGETVEYYRARAAEYEEWWERRGRYQMRDEAQQCWFAEREQLYRVFDSLRLAGHVLEPAPGTGVWTRRLICTAQRITAVDTSPEMLEINRAVVDSPKVEYVLADIFTWEPSQTFDAVVFGFWISHVPAERLNAFFAWLASCLRPGGQLFFVDNLRDQRSTAADQVLPSETDQVAVRKLNDGRLFRIVKTFYDAQELTSLCHQAGLEVMVQSTPTYFYYGVGKRK